MPRELKNGVNYKMLLAVLSVLTFISGLASTLFDSFLIPIGVAFFAALLLYESKGKRIMSYLIPMLTAIVCAIISLPDAIFVLPIILGGILIAYYFAGQKSKSECVFILVIIYSLFIFLLFIVIALKNTGIYTVDSVIEFYGKLYKDLKAQFLLEIKTLIAEMSTQGTSPENYKLLTDEYILELFDITVAHIPAIVISIGFLYAGISMKLFSHITRRVGQNEVITVKWSFTTPIIFAYFYVIVSLFGIFFNDGSTLALAISNITTILMVVYAYLGIRALLVIGRLMSRRRLLAFIIVFSVLFLNVIAIEIYSFVGVFFTISQKRFLSK